MSNPTCESCRFIRAYHNSYGRDDSHRECHRHAPIVSPTGRSGWPTTSPHAWCGEHQPREEAENRGEQVEALQQLLDECVVAAGSTGLLWRELPDAIRKMGKPAPAPEGWRPIETAPRDGTTVIAFTPTTAQDPSSHLVFTTHVPEQYGSVTHWRPLPDAPNEEAPDA